MAYYGSLGDIDVGAISKSISDTAVDVFVYDTRKDSDGGAWRKRTQHTSWYNETLNTATRGSRRDFPAVAIIVATSNSVTIYDGDDPDMPMWMVFNTTDGSMLRSGIITSISILNAELWVAHGSGSGVHWVNFLKDTARWLTASSSYGGFFIKRDISRRNESGSNYYNNVGGASDITIAGSSINDVAMTVLPSAPIDPSTGLPVPTIAVATAAGVSVIKDDGTVESTDFAIITRLGFIKGDRLAYGHRGGYEYAGRAINVSPFRNSLQYGYYINNSVPSFGNLAESAGNILGVGDGNVYGYQDAGIRRIFEDETNKANGMANYITTSYNTGWMHGDIKGAWLSDTSTASVTGELVTNGNFSSALGSEWVNYGGSNSATFQIVSGELEVTENGSADYGIVYQTIPVVSGRQYIASVTSRSSGTGTARWFIGSMGNDGIVGVVDTTSTSSVTNVRYFTATTTGNIVLQLSALNASNARAYFDNVSVRLVEPDRSVNNTGLAVYGTITKSAVATGSNLVAYSGFNGSNYLLNTSSYNFGSPSLCIMGWFKFTDVSEYQYIGSVFDSTSVQVAGVSFYQSTGTMYLYDANAVHQSTKTFNDGSWHFVTAIFNGSQRLGYVDGELVINSSNTSSLTLTNVSRLSVGHYNYANQVLYNFTGSLSLVRFSTSAPSPEQILKIYNDEKAFFQPNSQCTLYGSSDAVTALAYDDTTKLLSVGTSSGRSDFQGLERVANTTTAVTTAISASNGLIAEQ